MGRLNAFWDDLAQRLITFNKHDQREHLREALHDLHLMPGARVLDFGCGTALFAPVFLRAGFRYVGYDVDPGLTQLASQRYRQATFVHDLEALSELGPFDLILANCCFHHIGDAELTELMPRLSAALTESGAFLLMDLLLEHRYDSFFRRTFNRLERGAFVRRSQDYRRIAEQCFKVAGSWTVRSFLFSWRSSANPVYNDLVVFRCVKPATGRRQPS